MGEYDQKQKRNQASFNVAAGQAWHVMYLLRKATSSYLSGNLTGWFWDLTALREIVNYDLKPEEVSELDEKEKNITGLKFSDPQFSMDDDDEEVQEKMQKHMEQRETFAGAVRLYQRKILDCLKKMGFFPNKEDRTRLGF